jgi:hypothetical protein
MTLDAILEAVAVVIATFALIAHTIILITQNWK